jgi:signal peptidase I
MFKLGIDKILGDSMFPTIKNGNYVIFSSSKKMKIIPNKVYRLSHPQFGSIIKRLAYEDTDGNFWFKGDSHNSTPLKQIGAIAKGQINGRIWLTIDSESGITFP